jgi:hypothetical protein
VREFRAAAPSVLLCKRKRKEELTDTEEAWRQRKELIR